MTNWLYTDKELKRILARNNYPDNEVKSVKDTVKELLPHLKTTKCYDGLSQLVLDGIAKAKTFHTFNQWLSVIYDYCDQKKIWTGFMGE